MLKVFVVLIGATFYFMLIIFLSYKINYMSRNKRNSSDGFVRSVNEKYEGQNSIFL